MSLRRRRIGAIHLFLTLIPVMESKVILVHPNQLYETHHFLGYVLHLGAVTRERKEGGRVDVSGL